MAGTTTEPKKKCTCTRCKRTMSEIKFYSLKNGEKDNICKECLCAHVNNFEPETFLWILERYDVPYLPSEWNVLRDRAYQQDHKKIGGAAVVGKYLGKFKLKQWIDPETKKPYTWADSARLQAERNAETEMTEEDVQAEQERLEQLKKAFEEGTISEAEFRTLSSTETQQELDYSTDFPGASPQNALEEFDKQYMSEDELPDPAAELTDEDKIYLAMKWGRLYKPNEWVSLEKKYAEMMSGFDIQDPDTLNTLILMCKTDLKMNQALDCGDIDTYQKLARVNDGLRKSANFTAAQNKDKDNEKIDCVGVLVAVCERKGGFIPNELVDTDPDMIDVSVKDTQKYLYNLITKDLGFGQQIENYLKKIQLEHDNMEALENEEDIEEITDENIAEYYERIEEEKEEDSYITQESNAYERKKG